uniref:Uncharacterized protein n=1 Tax=Meloidogyne javanica TaxID=6303 RepID=A0A915MLR2_MELJA
MFTSSTLQAFLILLFFTLATALVLPICCAKKQKKQPKRGTERELMLATEKDIQTQTKMKQTTLKLPPPSQKEKKGKKAEGKKKDKGKKGDEKNEAEQKRPLAGSALGVEVPPTMEAEESRVEKAATPAAQKEPQAPKSAQMPEVQNNVKTAIKLDDKAVEQPAMATSKTEKQTTLPATTEKNVEKAPKKVDEDKKEKPKEAIGKKEPKVLPDAKEKKPSAKDTKKQPPPPPPAKEKTLKEKAKASTPKKGEKQEEPPTTDSPRAEAKKTSSKEKDEGGKVKESPVSKKGEAMDEEGKKEQVSEVDVTKGEDEVGTKKEEEGGGGEKKADESDAGKDAVEDAETTAPTKEE